MQTFDSPTDKYQTQTGLLGRNRWLKWLAILGVWVVLGLIYAGPIYLEVRSEGMNHSLWRVLSWGVLSWCVWAPLTPAIVWLARRYSFVGAAWKRSLLVHIPAFLILSAAHSAAATVITLAVKLRQHGRKRLGFLAAVPITNEGRGWS